MWKFTAKQEEVQYLIIKSMDCKRDSRVHPRGRYIQWMLGESCLSSRDLISLICELKRQVVTWAGFLRVVEVAGLLTQIWLIMHYLSAAARRATPRAKRSSLVDSSIDSSISMTEYGLTPSFPNEPGSGCNGGGDFLGITTISKLGARCEAIWELDESIDLHTKVRPYQLSFRAITK